MDTGAKMAYVHRSQLPLLIVVDFVLNETAPAQAC
jgi:hypothetical protein